MRRRRPARFVLVACLAVVAALAAFTPGATAGTTGSAKTYLVVYKSTTSPADSVAKLTAAGGTVIANYRQIGVAVVSSSSSSFRTAVLKDTRVDGVSATSGFAVKLDDDDASGPPPGDLPNSPATDSDSLSNRQWDMAQIHTPEAHAITGGSPSVLVGDIDTGLDYTHPDLAANVDDAASANCVSGVAVPGKVAANDDNGHGTHTAGTIAAASNGIGIVGVAPNVKIAGIKAGNAAGFFFPEAVICAFMWAGTHGIDVTNNSYFADPWLFNCKNDPVQRAIWKAEQRAINFAQQNGVTVIASAGNQFEDISHPSEDDTSPDDTTPIDGRRVTNACAVVPVEVPGVVGVSATGSREQDGSAGQYADNLKSFYSSFGVGAVDVTAPGGDSLFPRAGLTSITGRVLSTWPASLLATTCLPARQVVDASGATYCYQQGTSMAGPHAVGVAALILSRYGPLSRGQLVAMLEGSTDAQVCPSSLPAGYETLVGTDDEQVQTCQGGLHNSWYGSGQVDALNAVTR